jgi:Glycosyl hydrolase family 99
MSSDRRASAPRSPLAAVHRLSRSPFKKLHLALRTCVRAALLVVLVCVLLAADRGEPGLGRPQQPTDVGWPVRAAFYYPWFPESEHWATRYTPSLGKYDSGNPRVVATHVAQARYAGLDAFIASYWGQGTPTARRLPLLLDVAARQGFHIAAYYEPESLPTPPSSSLLSQDFDSLHRLTAHPAWLRVVDRPVLFIYNIGPEAKCSAVSRLLAANHGRFYLSLKVFDGYRDCPEQPDSWHQYVPARGFDQQNSHSVTVSPGFFKFNELVPRLARDPERFQADLRRQVASGARWQLITSFNEWGEGTAVEPSRQWESASGYGTYLDAMRSVYY